MTVGFGYLDAHEIELSMADPTLGDDLLGELSNSVRRAFQKNSLQTFIVIEMCMHGRDGQVVVGVLDDHESFGQLSFVVVIDIGDGGDARPSAIPLLFTNLEVRTQDVAYRLASRCVSLFFDETVERVGEILVE
jgi:hypothetical protein